MAGCGYPLRSAPGKRELQVQENRQKSFGAVSGRASWQPSGSPPARSSLHRFSTVTRTRGRSHRDPPSFPTNLDMHSAVPAITTDLENHLAPAGRVVMTTSSRSALAGASWHCRVMSVDGFSDSHPISLDGGPGRFCCHGSDGRTTVRPRWPKHGSKDVSALDRKDRGA